MICSRCNVLLPDDAICCYKCATPTDVYFTATNARRVEPLGEEKTLFGNQSAPVTSPTKFFVGGLVVILAGVIVIAGLNVYSKLTEFERASQRNSNAINSVPAQLPPPATPATEVTPAPRPKRTPKPRTEPVPEPTAEANNYQGNILAPTNSGSGEQLIVNGAFSVGAFAWRYFQFTLTNYASVSGSFVANGGGRNNIQCLIMSQADFVNWSNSNSYRTYYKSEVVTTESFSRNLPPGNYVLVFYNPEVFAGRGVWAKVGYQY